MGNGSSIEYDIPQGSMLYLLICDHRTGSLTFTINITTIKRAISNDIMDSARNYLSLFRVFVSILSKENWVVVLLYEPGLSFYLL